MTTAQQTETAYRMNLTGFEKLILQCEALGKTYKPSDKKLKLTALNKLKDEVTQAIKENRERVMEYLKASNERSMLDRETQKRTKLVMKAIPPPPRPTQAEKEEFRKMSREEWMKRERPPLPPFHEEIQQIRYSPGLRHVNARTASAENSITEDKKAQSPTRREWQNKQADALASLAGKLHTMEGYNPETEEIRAEALQALSQEMQQKNEAAHAAAEAKKQADEKLHALFYHAEDGLVTIANEVKAHIVETTEPDSDIHRLVSVIMFHNPTSAT